MQDPDPAPNDGGSAVTHREQSVAAELAETEARTSTSSLTKRYQVRTPEPPAVVLEEAQLDRIKRRVLQLDEGPSGGTLSNGAFAALGIGASAFIGAIVLPHDESAAIPSWVVPTLWTTVVACAVLTVVLGYAASQVRRIRGSIGVDIVDEIDTIAKPFDRAPDTTSAPPTGANSRTR